MYVKHALPKLVLQTHIRRDKASRSGLRLTKKTRVFSQQALPISSRIGASFPILRSFFMVHCVSSVPRRRTLQKTIKWTRGVNPRKKLLIRLKKNQTCCSSTLTHCINGSAAPPQYPTPAKYFRNESNRPPRRTGQHRRPFLRSPACRQHPAFLRHPCRPRRLLRPGRPSS